MGVVLSRFSHLVSTGKQFDPTCEACHDTEMKKTWRLERVTKMHAARTATPRASES